MKKANSIKKLSLARETVANLLSKDLEKAFGGNGPRLGAGVSDNWENTTCL